MTDARELFLRHRAGDPGALNELVQLLTPGLLRFTRRTGLPPDAAEDAVQETWITLIRSAAHYDASQPFLPWLHAVLRHVIVDHRRREQTRVRVLATACPRVAASRHETIAAVAACRETAAALTTAIAGLPKTLREPMRLHLVEGLTPKAVAERLGLPRTLVRVRLFQGRSWLRRRLPLTLGVSALVPARDPRPRSLPARLLTRRGLLAVAAACVIGLPALLLWQTATNATAARSAPAATQVAKTTADESGPVAVTRTDHAVPVPPTPPRLAIFVRDPNGNAVPSVAVTTEPDDGRDPRLHRETVVTNADGIAWFATADTPRYVFTDRGDSMRIAAGATRSEMRLSTDRIVDVIVVDSIDRPVEGAAIWLGARDDGHGAVVATTSADGKARLRAVDDGAMVAAFAPGCLRTARVSTDGAGPVKLRVVAGDTAVRLRVLNAAGIPIEEAVVIAGHSLDGIRAAIPVDVPLLVPPAQRTRTDARGEGTVCGLEPGRHPILVLAPGHAPFSTDTVVHPGCNRIECRLADATPLHGRIVDPAGVGIAGARVLLQTDARTGDILLRSAADGTFVAECPPRTGQVVAASDDTEVTIRAFDMAIPAACTLTLVPLFRWQCLLVDSKGLPLAGHEVRFASSEEWVERPDRVAISDPIGAFSVVAPGTRYCRISVRGADWPFAIEIPASNVHRVGANFRLTVDRQFIPSARLRGRLRTHDGMALAERSLSCVITHPSGWHLTKVRASTTDQDGWFDLGLLPPMPVTLTLDAPPDGSVTGIVGTFELAPDATQEVDLLLPAPTRVSGSFTLPDGSTPNTTTATLRVPGSQVAMVSQLHRLNQLVLPGTYSLVVAGEGHANHVEVLRLAGKQTCVDRQLERTMVVNLHLVDWRDDAREGAEFWVVTKRGRLLLRHVIDPHLLELPTIVDELPAGAHTAELRYNTGRVATAALQVEATDGPQDLCVVFEPR
ncbi:MAG: sigma-70 family RNA polymerase sigma factor [Planctomycetes bacterium]|nr:sigma-70 family RNA polymerase sigma factor [Planctomycetota bacterium]